MRPLLPRNGQSPRILARRAYLLACMHEAGHAIVVKALGLQIGRLLVGGGDGKAFIDRELLTAEEVGGLAGLGIQVGTFGGFTAVRWTPIEYVMMPRLQHDAIMIAGYVATRMCPGHSRFQCLYGASWDISQMDLPVASAVRLARRILKVFWKELLDLAAALSMARGRLSARKVAQIARVVNKTNAKRRGVLPPQEGPLKFAEALESEEALMRFVKRKFGHLIDPSLL